MDELFIRKAIRKLLAEKSEDPEPEEESPSETFRYDRRIITSVLGRPPAGMSQRAKVDPNGLLQDLKVSSATGGTMIEKIESLLSQAIDGNDEMGDAFSDVDTIENHAGREGVVVRVGELSPGQGARFIKEVLLAARNSGMLPMSDDIRVDAMAEGVIVYASKDGRKKWYDAS